MSSNWWASKLGANTPSTPAYTPPTPPVAYTPQQPTVNTPAQSPRCPGCGSGNYVGTAETRSRCYDCGYPIVQQGSGVIASGGPSRPAKQAQGTGFNPSTFINK